MPEKIVDIIEKNGRVDFQISKTASASSVGILIGDLYGYICDVNDWVVEMFGASDKSELVGRHYLEFLLKEDRAIAVQRSTEAIMNSREMIDDYRVRLKNGQEAKLEVNTSFLRDENGEKIGFIDIINKIG